MPSYPKRLIEVDLPIKRISAHARREKSIRHGHISTLHIWWARRPLAACRAVICASLWPDPADELCPPAFRQAAAHQIQGFVQKVMNDKALAESCDPISFGRWNTLSRPEGKLDLSKPAHLTVLRDALLDFIADFANWDNSTVLAYVETSRALTQAAHEALGGAPGTRPLVVDPFAGGGAIPLEALRVGADAFASDLNPVAVLLNKVVLEYIPKYGQQLTDEVRRWGEWIKQEAEKELAEFYPQDVDGATPIAYLWARTIGCEGPGCGTEVPLMRSLWLAKKGSSSVALQLLPNKRKKCVDIIIIEKQGAKWFTREESKTEIKHPQFEGTVKRGSATCPVCGYTTPVASVRRQLRERRGGSADARLLSVVVTKTGEKGRLYRLSTQRDLTIVKNAVNELERRKSNYKGEFSLVPDEEISLNEIRRISVPIYGMTTWADLFTPRQLLALTTYTRLVTDAGNQAKSSQPTELESALQTILALAVSRFSDICNALCMWEVTKTQVRHVFTRQAIGMIWDFAEPNIFGDAAGDLNVTLATMLDVLQRLESINSLGHVEIGTATAQLLADDSAQAIVTDPPYYDAVPYAHLAEFFYVWLHRCLNDVYPDMFHDPHTPKELEIVVDRPHELSNSTKGVEFYESELTRAFFECHRVLQHEGICIIVFASKTTASWEAILQATVDSGWIITGSWPIDTEMETRVAAQGQARLASSIHLVARPREKAELGKSVESIGDWRDVLAELPRRIHEWMPRLAQEGVVGADAIFACLGPALEIFSRYGRVEKASGEQVTLKEYLEYVWAAVAREALAMIFTDADTTGFEEDSRLTAMWLWTLTTKDEGGRQKDEKKDENGEVEVSVEEPVEEDEEEPSASGNVKPSGYILEYDAARKIAQGLGAHLEQLTSLVEVKGNKARLLPVADRAEHLFGKDDGKAPAKSKKKVKQRSFFEIAEAGDGGEDGWGEMSAPKQGITVLDRVHQSMLLFAAGRGDALKRFLVDENVGSDQRFWRLAQAFSALYPTSSDEKRWVDGVLARKKGLGF